MSRDYHKFLEQPYEYYCYNSVKPINVSHNTESKHTSAWTMIDHTKLQYVHLFPDTKGTKVVVTHNTILHNIEQSASF